ncbi:monovalent cation/H+ antiporter subunit D family protein [Magnetococcales bacterium HHB-1]
MIAAHYVALQVVLPLISAPICALFPRRSQLTWGIALVVTGISLFMSFNVLNTVLDHGLISYELGGWVAPLGIEYRIDVLSSLLMIIVSAIGAFVLLYARHSVEREIGKDRIHLFYTMYLLSFTGLLGMTVTGDVFNLFVFLEISSLSTYVLISMGAEKNGDPRALTAAYRYLILGTIGATFYVIGVGLMYMMTGTLNMADLVQRLPQVIDTGAIQAALAFLTVGMLLKAAVFPLHIWLPNAYAYAPSVVSAFLAATATKVSIYVLLRIFFTMFGSTNPLDGTPLSMILILLSIVAMFVGSIIAITQVNLKKLLAYSSVAQIGYIILGIVLATETGLIAGLVHLFNHAVMKCALFLALGAILAQRGSIYLNKIQGVGKQMPWTVGAFVTAGLSVIGVPLTAGFVSKWYLLKGVLEQGWWFVALLILISSLLAVIYIWKVIEVAYFKPVPENAPEAGEAPLSMLLPLWIMAGASVYFGIDANTTVDIAKTAAQSLLGGAP